MLRGRGWAVLTGGIVAEALNAVVFSDFFLPRVTETSARGTPAAIALAIAVFAALLAGARVGAVVAFAGWALFVALVAPGWGTVVALPVWVGTALAVGFVSARVQALEWSYHAIHELRSPLAAILGLTRTLDQQTFSERDQRVLVAIEDAASEALTAFDAIPATNGAVRDEANGR